MGKDIKKNKLISSIFILILLSANFIISIPKITAPPPPSLPDQFIGEILSNRTLSLNLLNSNVVIKINSTYYPFKIGINFDANYTFFNPENNTDIKLVLPFSLAIEVNKSDFSVKLNNTQIDFDLTNFTEGNINSSEIDLNFISMFQTHNPIILIQSNLTNLENISYTIEYKFSGLINKPFKSRDVLSFIYYLNTSKTWYGNTTGRVEFRIFGKLPGISNMYVYYCPEIQILDISGGKSVVWEWNNRKMNLLAIGITYDLRDDPFSRHLYIEMIITNVIFSILIMLSLSGIINFIAVRKKSRKRN